MGKLNLYIRAHLDKPLKDFCGDKGITPGIVINMLLDKKLKKEGYL